MPRVSGTNTWLERGSDTVGCHRFNLLSFLTFLHVVREEKHFEYCLKVTVLTCVFQWNKAITLDSFLTLKKYTFWGGGALFLAQL